MDNKETKTDRVIIRCTPSFKRALEQEAVRCHQTFSDLVRFALLEWLQSDEEDADAKVLRKR